MRLARDFSGFVIQFLRCFGFCRGIILQISSFQFTLPSQELGDPKWTCFGHFPDQVSLTMVTAPLTFLWDGRWGDESSVPGGRDLLLLDLCLDLIYAVYLLLMLEMSYLHPERRTEIVTRRRVIRSRLRSPLYWLKWLSVSAYFWVLAFDAPLVINLLKVRGPKNL